MSNPKPPEGMSFPSRGHLRRSRRVVRRTKKIPTLSELKLEANDHGMTVKEYVDFLNSRNMDRSTRRNKSSSYDMGPEPFRKERE